jgi:hypothetical protein
MSAGQSRASAGRAGRAIGVLVAVIVVCALIGLYIGLYLTNAPPSAAAVQTPNGPHLYLATVPAAEPSDPHNTWVSYYQVDANSQHWQHATTYVLPANTLVHVTIYQYDGASGLRNEFLSQVQGTVGNTFTLNGTTVRTVNPTTASHLFAVPQIGLYVPLQGISDSAKNPCGNAPCSLSNDHETIAFTFRTPGKGLYRWQCFVPCAAGFIQGFGGPMQTVGYMGGFIKVV